MVKERRFLLSAILNEIEGLAGVYFQPPKTVKMKYPCIIYKRDGANAKYADNLSYIAKQRYTVTIVDKDPDSELPSKLMEAFSYISFDRDYTADNLNHFVFTLYF